MRMWWRSFFVVAAMVFLASCSAQQHKAEDDFFFNDSDPFADDFYTQSPEWDNSVLQQSEVLSDRTQEEEELPRTWTERSSEIIFATLLVGGTLAKLALPMLGGGI